MVAPCAVRIERSAASIRAGDASPTRWDRNRISYGDRDCLFELKTTSALLDIANAWFDRSTKHTSMPARSMSRLAIAVGTALTGGPPRRSQRAGLPHWAPALGVWRQSVPPGRGA